MAPLKGMKNGVFLIAAAALFLVASCDKLADAVDASRTNVKRHLNGLNIYDRNNIPNDPPPTKINGYYDIINGAFRYITNEEPTGRDEQDLIRTGDSVSFYFDARTFSSTWDNSTTYYTNLKERIAYISNSNPEFNGADWPTEPLRIKVGDGNIIKGVDSSLPSCMPGDIVRIFLPPDVAYGSKTNGNVPARSTLVFELTDIQIIEP